MANPIRQLLSQTSYVADGSQTVWNFSFSGGYIDKSHVKAKYLDAARVEHQIAVTPGMFLGQYQLNITPPIAAGSELVIYRDTPKEGPLVDFIDAASLTEASLDLSAKQGVFVAAESSDGWTTIIEATNVAGGKQVTLATAQAVLAAAANDAAAVSAANALTSENAASDKAAEASGHANAASGQADLAAHAAATTQTLRDSIIATQGAIGYLPPVAYTAGLAITLPAQTVSYSGQAYAPLLSALPFTTSGAFEVAKFRLIQGVAAVNLAAAGGAGLVGLPNNRTVKTFSDEFDSVKRRGANGDAIADDATSLQAGLSSGKPLLINSAVGYKSTVQLTSAGTGGISGEGLPSAIIPSGLSAATDALAISPPADGNSRDFFEVDNFYLLQSAGGRHAVSVDASATGKAMSRFLCSRSYLRANGLGNYAFKVINPTNAVDRFFASTFSNNVFDGGLALDGVGDSMNVSENTFTGVNEGLYLTQTTNISSGGRGDSSMCVIERNNSTANKGIYIIDAQAPKIKNNNFECGAGPGAGAELALVNLKGLTQRVIGAEVTGNTLNHAPNCTTGVYVGNTEGALIENNVFGIAATGFAIVVSANSKNARIGVNNFIPRGTGREVSDSGVGTMGVIKYPTLLNSWTNYGSGHKVAQYVKGLDSFVRLDGVIALGTTTGNTLLFTLPGGFVPEGRSMFPCHIFAVGGGFYTGVIRIDADGSVYLRYVPAAIGPIAEVSLSGIHFYAPQVV